MRRILTTLAVLLLGSAVSAQQAPRALSLEEAIAMAFEKNGDVIVERESAVIADASVRRAEAVYEPTLRGDARFRHRTDPVNSILSGAPVGEVAPTINSFQSSASVAKLLPSGASLSVFSGLNRDSTDSVLALLTPSWSTTIGAELRQPLMQNRRIDPARRAIRLARIDRGRSLNTLRRIASETTAAVERAWWALEAARRDVEVRANAVDLAEKQREDTRVRIEAGVQPEADLSQTTAEVERRRGELIASRESVTRSENALRALIISDPNDPLWRTPIEPDAAGEPVPDTIDIEQGVATALQRRPEIGEIAARIQRSGVELESALDRLKPQVDLVAAWSGRGLAGSENEDAMPIFGRDPVVPDALDGSLGRSLGTIGEGRFPDASLGVAVTIPLGNTAARQDVVIARATQRQASTVLDQVRQRVALEVRNAGAALDSAVQRMAAARAAREAAVVQLQAERDRFEAGTSNTFFILTRQNDLAAAQLAETIARADYRKARTEFARATGVLLEERGIEISEAGGVR